MRSSLAYYAHLPTNRMVIFLTRLRASTSKHENKPKKMGKGAHIPVKNTLCFGFK